MTPSATGPRSAAATACSSRLLKASYRLPLAATTHRTEDAATLGNPLIPCVGCTLSNPFPRGLNQPIGDSLGVLTGVGGDVDFADPNARMGRFQRYSFEIQRMVGPRLGVSIAYLGSRGDHLSPAVEEALSTSIKSIAAISSWVMALRRPVANPFYGTPLSVGISRARKSLSHSSFDRTRSLPLSLSVDRTSASRVITRSSRRHAVASTTAGSWTGAIHGAASKTISSARTTSSPGGRGFPTTTI